MGPTGATSSAVATEMQMLEHKAPVRYKKWARPESNR